MHIWRKNCQSVSQSRTYGTVLNSLVCLDPPQKLHRCSCGRSFLRHSGHWHTQCKQWPGARETTRRLIHHRLSLSVRQEWHSCSARIASLAFQVAKCKTLLTACPFFFKHCISAFFFSSPSPLSYCLFRLPLMVEGIGSRADSGPISHSVSAGTVIKAVGRRPVPAAAQFSH